MEMNLLEKLGIALRRLESASPDGVSERNDVGFNAHDLTMGCSLAASYPNWTPKQADMAHRIASRYRNTQLSDLGIPAWSDDPNLASKVVEAARAEKVAAQAGLPEWGIQWGQPKTVSTKQGLRTLRSGKPSEAFWAEWRSSKEALRSKGYSVSRNGADWEVLHWGIPTPAPVEEEPKPDLKPIKVPTHGLLAYQVDPVIGLVDSLRRLGAALDGSDTGTGKTYTTLAAMRALGISPLVIAPKAVIPSWERAAKHLGMSIRVINYEKVRTGNTIYGKWTTLDYNGRTLDRFEWSKHLEGLIFDEAHRCKGTKTQNAQLLIAAKHQSIPVIAASATNVTSPLDMRALGYVLGLHNLRDFWQWAEAHGCFKNHWDGWEFGGSASDIDAIHREIFPKRGVRIRVRDLGDRFPATRITTTLVDVQAPSKVSSAYKELAKTFEDIETRKKGDKQGAEHLTAMLRARQVSEAQKIPAMIEMTEDALEEGRSVVLAVNFNDSIRALKEVLGRDRKVSVIHGEQTAVEREENIQAFQTNKVHVIIINLRAGGVGVSLHDLHGRPRTAIISPSWSAVDLKQALGRVWRAGGVSGSVQHILYARGTVEERVAELLQLKLDRLTVFNDGLAELDVKDSEL